MTDKKLTDNEIKKACKDCLHYEACKGTYSSAKGEEDILYDFDGEMYASSGCEDFKDKDLINRQKADIKKLTSGKCVYLSDDETTEYCVEGPCPKYKTVAEIKAEAYKEYHTKAKACLKANRDIEQQIGNNCAAKTIKEIENRFDNILKELVGEQAVKECENNE